MTVCGSPSEINSVLKAINPNYPEQHFENIESGVCHYILNGVDVAVLIMDEVESDG